jgi:beta-phosphoglucomutase
MIKAVLFDMDGVLIDAKDWHYEALNRALGHFGLSISRDSHLSTFDGLPTRQKLKMLSKSRGLPEELHEFINALKQSYTQEISQTRCKPSFNHQYALSKLKHEGYRLAVCSNSVRQSVETMMQLSALMPFLDFVISNEDVLNGKPDPEMYLRAMSALDVKPEECLILEDNEHGIQAAISSGGHLLKIGIPDDVTYRSIKARITELNKLQS